jgi:hypothetical protein
MRLIIPIATAAAVAVLATACSPQPASKSPGSSPTSASPDAGLLTGAQLKNMLAPASWFPSGYDIDPTGSVNTGSTYEPPTPPGSLPCTRLNSTGWEALSGVGSVSFAQNDYVDQDTSEEYAQEIDVFQGSGAQQAMAGLRKLATTCPTFSDSQTSSTVTVSLQSGPSLGDDALTLMLSDPSWEGGTALEAVRVGSAVVTILCSVNTGNGASQATSLSTLLATNVGSKIKS